MPCHYSRKCMLKILGGKMDTWVMGQKGKNLVWVEPISGHNLFRTFLFYFIND